MARPLRRQPRCGVLERRLGRNLGTGRQSHPDTFEILQRPGRDIARHVEKLRPGSRLRRQTRRGGACLRGADPPRVAEVALPLHGRRAGARRCDARGLLPFRRGPRVRRQHPEGDHPRHPERQSITPCLVGKATARANSYEGYDIELKQLFCTMYVSVKKEITRSARPSSKPTAAKRLPGTFRSASTTDRSTHRRRRSP